MTLKSSMYYYYPTTLTETNDVNAKVGIASTSPEYKMLFTNSSTGADTANAGNTNNIYYWLGSQFVITYAGRADFGVCYIYPGRVSYNVLYFSHDTAHTQYYGIRPVVSLDSKVTLKDSGTQKDGCKLYNMSLDK